jgi:putative tricarboxylic transport membrane protein
MSYGIEPGPLLLTKEPDLVWVLIASLFIGNFFLLVLNLPLAPTWAKLLRIPRPYLYAGILFFASMGAYAVKGQPFDLFLLLGLGLLGFAMRRFGLPVLPLIVGTILGPRFELHLRRSLQGTGGDASGLLGGPVAWVCYGVVIVVLLWPLVARLRRVIDRGTGNDGGPGGGAAGGPGGPHDSTVDATRSDDARLAGRVDDAGRDRAFDDDEHASVGRSSGRDGPPASPSVSTHPTTRKDPES